MEKLFKFVYVHMRRLVIWYENLPWTHKNAQNEYDDILYEFIMSRLS